MKYYKLDNQVFAFEADGSQDEYVKPEMALMTENEFIAHTNSETMVYDAETDSAVLDSDLVALKKGREQELAWENIKQRRLIEITAGVYIPSIDKHFHTDDVSSILYSQIGTAIALGLFQPLNWKTMEGDLVNMTEELFRELQALMIAQTQTNYARAEYHKFMMLAAESPLDYNYNEW